MTLIELIMRADEGYTKGFSDDDGENCHSSLLDCLNPETGEPEDGHGDTLALFVVRELKESFNPDASDYDQLGEAIRVMTRAKDDLENVVEALDNASVRVEVLVVLPGDATDQQVAKVQQLAGKEADTDNIIGGARDLAFYLCEPGASKFAKAAERLEFVQAVRVGGWEGA